MCKRRALLRDSLRNLGFGKNCDRFPAAEVLDVRSGESLAVFTVGFDDDGRLHVTGRLHLENQLNQGVASRPVGQSATDISNVKVPPLNSICPVS